MSTRNARRQAKKRAGRAVTKETSPGVLPWEKARATLGRQLLRTAPAPDGVVRPMCVLRPKDPVRAINLARMYQAKNDAAAFARLPEVVRDYTFAGYLTITGYVAGAEGEIVGNVQPGDSFTLMQEEFAIGEEFQQLQPEANGKWGGS